MWKIWIVQELCTSCKGKDKRCEEFIPWLTSQNDQTFYINLSRASASELCAAAEQAESNCPVCAIKIRKSII